MKNLALILLAATLVSLFSWEQGRIVHAQSSGTFVMLQVGAPSACAWPAGATFTNAMAMCATTSGLYYSLNGSAAFNPVGQTVAAPTTINCPITSTTLGPGGLVASSCAIK
jgi:hypothetical protein